jgi:hypothetical protein
MADFCRQQISLDENDASEKVARKSTMIRTADGSLRSLGMAGNWEGEPSRKASARSLSDGRWPHKPIQFSESAGEL